MEINIASKNPVKISAVKEVIQDYKLFSGATLQSIEVSSEVSEQPLSLDEVVSGAINRSRNAFVDCDYSFGLESGLIAVPQTKTGYMDICACSIYNGKPHLGLSCAFEFPLEVTELIFKNKLDANQAFFKTDLTENEKLGSAEGAIGMLTKGRVTRKDYTKQAIIMALIQVEHPGLYLPKPF